MTRIGFKQTTAVGDAVFGLRLKPIREANKWTQEQLALEMQERGFEFTQVTIYKIETGKRKVSVAEALALAEILDTDINALTADSVDDLSVYQTELRLTARELYRAITEAEIARSIAVHISEELKEQIVNFEKIHGIDTELNFNGVKAAPKKYFDRLIWFGDGHIGQGFEEDDERERDFELAAYLGMKDK